MGARVTTASASTQVASGNDCELFWEISKKLNFSQLEKIQKAERGWMGTAEDLYQSKSVSDRFFHKRSSVKKEFTSFFKALVFIVVVAVLLSAIIGLFLLLFDLNFLPSFAWSFLVLATVGILAAMWVFYIDIVLRAMWRYWRVDRKKPRETIKVEDITSYLITQLQSNDFGHLVDLSVFHEHRDALDYYRNAIKRGKDHLGSGADIEEGGKYSSVYNKLSDKIAQIDEQLEKVDNQMEQARKVADKLAQETLPNYKKEAVHIRAFLEEMRDLNKGEEDDKLIKETRQKLSVARQQVIDEIESFNQHLQEARRVLDNKLKELKLLRNKVLQPIGRVQSE